jgi:hypothetical protein
LDVLLMAAAQTVIVVMIEEWHLLVLLLNRCVLMVEIVLMTRFMLVGCTS